MHRSRSYYSMRQLGSVQWTTTFKTTTPLRSAARLSFQSLTAGRRRRHEDERYPPTTTTTTRQWLLPDSPYFRASCSSPRLYHGSPTVSFSDRLLGHSPMSPGSIASSTSTTSAISAIPTAHDVTTSGGVWAPTSSKRDKLGELTAALEKHERTLEDAATPEQLYDLWLCEGVSAIASTADYYPLITPTSSSSSSPSSSSSSSSDETQQEQTTQRVGPKAQEMIQELNAWWDTKNPPSELAQIQFENLLRDFAKEVEHQLASSLPPNQCLRDARDFMDLKALNDRNPKWQWTIPEEDDDETTTIWNQTSPSFDTAVLRYRLELARAAAQTLQNSWSKLTKVTDQDIDRAAVQGTDKATLKVSKLSTAKVKTVVLEAFFQGTAHDRVDAIWHLMDRDGDERLDEVEMNQVCDLVLAPVPMALERLWNDAMDASPLFVRRRLPKQPHATTKTNNKPDLSNNYYYEEPPLIDPPKLSWYQRRQERLAKKRLSRLFQKALKRHFVDEVEQAHRLRCIYAWANKAHQDNKVDSVLIDNNPIGGESSSSSSSSSSTLASSWGGVVGRKRYVELAPKISLSEFREVQQEHFTHLDRVGAEYMKSVREDLWIVQGKGRQNRELWRDCAIFMTAVCVADVVITLL
ncbi:hypothetical protein ACA910_014449 [Epithemia clementina (nom. ined.)]